ncbi:MAG: response regulator [Deltaproteobacteria bacterium]|nr:response regulator [Deltaproteobacteria bacterium]
MTAEILVVDDDTRVLEILSESLHRNGYHVRQAISGREALETYQHSTPQLVILDMALPDMTGFDVLKEFRAHGGSDVPVVFLSANGDVDMRVEGLEQGAEEYLVKPVSLRELNSKVEKILARSTRTRALRDKSSSLQTQLSRRREDQSKMNKEIKRQLLSMRTLFSVSQDINRLLDATELVNVVSLTLLGELQVSSMAMFALERENSRKFSLLGVKGFNREKFTGVDIERQGRFVSLLEVDQRPRKIARNPDRRWTRLLPDLRLAVFEYVTPIKVRGATKGLIFTGPKITSEEYNDYDLDMMMYVANSAGIGLENARMFKQLQITYVSTLRSLISIIEAKDTYTRGHTERVASYANAIAARLKLEEEHRRRVMFGALLHDIGKVGVLENVLHTKGKLDEDEWKLLQEHPVVGARVVEKMEFLSGVAEIVKHHHESWDGRGYPDGIKGEAIPLGARIITVADSFDAMTTDRSYRKALSVDEAARRLEGAAGTQFDPRIVRVFVNYVRSKGSEMIVTEPRSNEQLSTPSPFRARCVNPRLHAGACPAPPTFPS